VNESGWNPLDWDAFEQWLGRLPIDLKKGSFGKIDEYVDGIVKNAISQPEKWPAKPKGGKLPVELFQTHNYVIVRFTIPKGINPRWLHVFAAVQRLRLEGLPGDAKQYVTLPAPVSPESSRALYKEGVLQVKLLKRKVNERYEELFVRFE
jgi:HSP20 family molecular chaperone IbpA